MDELNEGIMNKELLENLPKDTVGELNEILLNTQEQCQMVEQLIKNQIEVKDGLIDRLHEELEYYKQDSADKFVEQLMKAVIKVRKDMKQRIKSDQWNEMVAEEVKREYQYVFEDLTDLLVQQNIDEFETSAGDLFDPSKQQAKVEVTQDVGLDKSIKQSLSAGYTKGNKVIIPERVVVYQYKDK